MKKNEIVKAEIIDNGINLEGIAKIDNMPCFIPNAICGEVAEVKILKVNTSYAFGKVEKILKFSEFRKDPDCCAYGKCGGCDGLHIEYDKLLDIKRETTINTLKKQGIDTGLVGHIHGMGNPYNYRNKLQYPVRNIKGMPTIGMYAKMSHNMVENEGCLIQNKVIDSVAKALFKLLISAGFSAYNETENVGDIKHIMVRIGIHTKDIMCVVVSSKDISERIQEAEIINELTKEYADIKSVILNVNKEEINAILSNQNILLYGENIIHEKIGEYTFKISASSFFQVNTIQAELLYHILQENLKLKKTDTVLELYSGVGSIGIFLSDSVKNVVGVEIVKEAVDAAKENVKINEIKNVEYILGDATKEINPMQADGKIFDAVIVDPPRKGLDKEGIATLLKLKADKIGYISCNPASLARDLSILKAAYNMISIELVDMFPWTSHVETVVLMELKK